MQTVTAEKTEEDDVMQEMQTLNVKPEAKESKVQKKVLEIKVDPVDIKTKIKVMDWLIFEVKLIKNHNNSEKLL
jgi:hypothetical protein